MVERRRDLNRGTRRRTLTAAAAVLAAAAATLLGAAGRGEASVATDCSQPAPAGRLVCITVEDLDGVSPSGPTVSGKQRVDVQAFGYLKLTVANDGGNTLTNGSVRITLTDVVDGAPAPLVSTAAFVPAGSASFCSVTSTSPNVVTCTLPNLAAGAATDAFYVAYRTSNTPGVISTAAEITTSFKEGSNQGANPATFTVFESTSLEPDPQLSVAWSPPGQDVRLGTSPADVQFSTLRFSVPADKSAFLASLAEGGGSICPAGATCSTELVTTNLAGAAAGTFSPQNPFTLTLTLQLDLLASRNLKDFVVYHVKDDGTLETISALCSTSAGALPCFTLTKDNRQKLLIVEIKAWENGRWQG
jgi:hypothetical protein